MLFILPNLNDVMGTQHHKTTPSDLLDEQGHIIEPGFATELLWQYDRSRIKGGWHRIKEWDYYYILDHTQQFGVTLTISDLGYMGLMAVCILDFQKNQAIQADTMIWFPKGKTNLPPHSGNGAIHIRHQSLEMDFVYELPKRHLIVNWPAFKVGKKTVPFKCDITLHQPPDMESMVIATSWKDKPTAFYYNQKINCMPASGTMQFGAQTMIFHPQTSMGGLDWGRGKWTYKNRWYWGSASGYINDIPFGWNFGYGFSDRSMATENMVFYAGKAHKLDEIKFNFNPNNYMEPWTITSNDDRCNLQFQPLIDRTGNTNFILLKSIQHQVFGLFSGTIILDDGTPLEIKDFLGFAEDVLNWW